MRLLTSESRVRSPQESSGLLAQWIAHPPSKREVLGSSPRQATFFDLLAHMVEHSAVNRKVVGSIPTEIVGLRNRPEDSS